MARKKVKNGFLRAIFSRPFRLTLSAPGSPSMVCERSSNKALTANIFVFWIDGRLKERWSNMEVRLYYYKPYTE